MGRLTEAIEPMRAAIRINVTRKNWTNAPVDACNLSDLDLVLGEIADAQKDAELAVTYADRSRDPFEEMSKRTTYADTLHQGGYRTEAANAFREAEQRQAKNQPNYPLLYSLGGFLYCDLLLALPECLAWRRVLGCTDSSKSDRQACCNLLRTISGRAAQALKWEEQVPDVPLLDLALHNLTLGRVALYETVIVSTDWPLKNQDSQIKTQMDTAVNGLRRAGDVTRLPSRDDLDEAWEIAERGPMRLHMADIHLYRARLFFRETEYPWESPEADLAAARKLIEQCGYWRRKEELEDAERVILQRSA